MTHDSSTSIDRCSKSQLKSLLSLAAGGDAGQASLLGRLGNRAQVASLLSDLLGESQESGVVVLSAAAASGTPLAVLQGTKELAKTLLEHAPTEVHRSAATFLYHLSIAAALARHDVNISTRSPDARLALYEDLASAFAGDPLGQVFRDAVDRVIADERSP